MANKTLSIFIAVVHLMFVFAKENQNYINLIAVSFRKLCSVS